MPLETSRGVAAFNKYTIQRKQTERKANKQTDRRKLKNFYCNFAQKRMDTLNFKK